MTITGKTIIIPLEGDFAHSADFLRQTALTLAANNNQVCVYDQNHSHFWLKGKPTVKYPKHHNLQFHTPRYCLPGRRWRWVERLNRRLSWWLFVHSLRQKNKILWFFYPNHFDLAQVKIASCIKIYDCVDYQENTEKEKQLIKSVDYFFVNSQALAKLHRHQYKQPILLAAQGFFEPDAKLIKKSPLKFDRPVIGFVGGINYRLDFPLLEQLISNNPHWQFVFYGPRQKNEQMDQKWQTKKWLNKIEAHPNTYFGQSSDRHQIYGIIKSFDVAIIPYNTKIAFNKYCYPMKVFEYLYFGKPVVSTPIEELTLAKFSQLLKIAITNKEFTRHIKEYLSLPVNQKLDEGKKQLALQNSWQQKIKSMNQHLCPLN